MHHDISLISTMAVSLVYALVGGYIASRLRLPPLVGYLIAGIVVGPFTPGFVADRELAPQLAEIGVILLMFGVGLHFSIRDLLAVRKIAIPGALVQIALSVALTCGLTHFWGWPFGPSLVLGLALSVASTVVLLRALESQGILDSPSGRIAVGWLIVEDLVTVLILVLLPALATAFGGVPGHMDHPAPENDALQIYQSAGHRPGQVHWICFADAGRRCPVFAVVARESGRHRFQRVVHAGCDCGCHRNRIRSSGVVRLIVCAGRILRRRRDRRIRSQPPGHRRDGAAPGCFHGAFLCGDGDAF